MPKKYYCNKCQANHYVTSKRGKEHLISANLGSALRYKLNTDRINSLIPFYQKVELHYFLPKDLIRKLRINLKTGSSPYIKKDKFKQTSILYLKEQLLKGEKLDPIWIWFEHDKIKGIQGRHRAIVSYQLGLTRVPVLYLINEKRWPRSKRNELRKYKKKKLTEFYQTYPNLT